MQRRILGILFGVLFIVMLGFSVLFPIEAFYLERFGATVSTMGWLLAVYSLAHFVVSPLWGRLSDRVGRKPVMMTGLLGYGVAMALFGLAGSIPELFLWRGLAGFFSAATLPTAMAVVADSTGASDRARGMGVLGAAFGLGVIFGPFIGGVLGTYQINLPFFVTASLSLVTLLLVWAFLPESLHLRQGQKLVRDRDRWQAFTRETTPLYLLAFLVTFSLAGLEAAFPFLAKDRLGLTPQNVGYVYAVMGLVAAGVQGGLVGPLRRAIGEERMIPLGLGLAAAGMGTIALAHTPLTATLGISLFGAGHGLIRPSNASLISQRAPVGHGLAIGVLDSMDAMGRVLGPVTGALLFSLRDTLPFVSGSAMNLAALIGFFILITGSVRHRQSEEIR